MRARYTLVLLSPFILTIAILAIWALSGMAGATNPIPNWNFGPASGVYIPGVVKTPYVTVDTDLYVGANANVVGTLTDGATVSSGTIGHWAAMGADLPFTCIGTANNFDWSNSTSGTFTTTGGNNLFRGHTFILGGKNVVMMGGAGAVNLGRATGTFIGVTGATYFNDTYLYGGKNLVGFGGAGYVDFGRMTGGMNGPVGRVQLNATKVTT
jgi:hypothetical protein